MSEIFADSGYWIALASPEDGLHRRALAAAERHSNRKIVTTEMVLTELFAHMSKMGRNARNRAVRTFENIRADPNIEIVPQTHEQFKAAVDRYAERLDQRWSLTDCASFLLMEDRGIFEALAHDRDFARAGFIPLMRDV